ncbi:MAG: hypothetical protein AAGA81_06000 [Acidobacteriota bacterium]
MRLEPIPHLHRPLLSRTPRSFGAFLLVRLSQAFAVVVLAVAALLGFTAFAEPAPGVGPEDRPRGGAVDLVR